MRLSGKRQSTGAKRDLQGALQCRSSSAHLLQAEHSTIFDAMSVQELELEIARLPKADLAALARWFDAFVLEAEEMAEVERRDAEIESGKVKPLSEAEFWRSVDADNHQ